jgi:gluconolactonase
MSYLFRNVLFLGLCFALPTTRADDFDLYYLGGQSNMEGFGTNSELTELERAPVEGAWIYHASAVADQQPALGLGIWARVEPGHGTGFASDGKSNQLSNRFGAELSFAAAVRQRNPHKKIAIIKYARNGSAIDPRAASNWGCWDPDFEAPLGAYRENNQYDQFLATVRSAMMTEDIDGDGTKDRLIPCGILWMQGESDAMYGEDTARNYERNLKRLMDLMRAALRADDLPVAIGRISDSKHESATPTWKHGELVRQAQSDFVMHDRSARLVTETDRYRYSDPWHYDSPGYIELGKRFAEAILAIPQRPYGKMFEEGAKLTVEVGAGAGGEGPAWDAELGVLSSGNGNIHRWSNDRVASVYREGAGTNGLLFDSQKRLLACEPKLKRVTRTERDGKLTVLTDAFEGKPYNTPNDLSLDSKGRIYFSDPRYGDRTDMAIHDANGMTVEGVYRIDLDGKVSRVIGREVSRANGVLVTADDRYLLVADNNNNTDGGARRLWRFELNRDGSVNPQTAKVLFDWGRGRGPDGLKQDVLGNLYVAGGLNHSNPPYEPDASVRAGVYVMNIEGQLLDFVPVPTDEVTNCAFGGVDRKTLYITGGGTLYSIRCKHAGYSH